MEKINEKKVSELREMAKTAGVKGYSRMVKNELIKIISNGVKSKSSAVSTKQIKKTVDKKSTMVKESQKIKTHIYVNVESKKKEQKKLEKSKKIPAAFVSLKTKKPLEEFKEASLQYDENFSKKFESGQTEISRLKHEEIDIPDSYGIDRLILLPKDANFLFCYWELSEDTIQKIKNSLDHPEPVLRIKISDDKEYKMPVDLRWKKYYVDTPEKGVPYVAELGFKTRDGAFYVILKSNVIYGPADSVSSNTEEIFLTIPFETPLNKLDGKQLFYLSPLGKLMSENEYKKLFNKGFAPNSTYGYK